MRIKINGKMSINFICSNLWAPTADLLQGVTILQHCVHQIKFLGMFVKSEVTGRACLVWSRTLSILLSSEWRKSLCLCSHSGPTLQAILP